MLYETTFKSLTNIFIKLSIARCFCVSKFKINILDSQYHRKGPSQFRHPAKMQISLQKYIKQIQSIQKQLDKQRQKLIELNPEYRISKIAKQKYLKHQQIQKYLQIYVELMKVVQSTSINNPIIYNFIGWYNMTFLYSKLIDRLLGASKQQVIFLVDSLAMMKSQQNKFQNIIDKDDQSRRKKQLFFSTLSKKLQVSLLRKLQKVLSTSTMHSKKVYYQLYVCQNIQKLVSSLHVKSLQQKQDIIWLFEMYIQTMNDNQIFVSKFQNFLQMDQFRVSHQSTQRLMNIYNLKGKINPAIYRDYIRPYLLQNKMNQLSNLIQTIAFIVNSECEDIAMLKQIYELIQIKYTPAHIIAGKHLYMLHLYTHYLRIKGYTVRLPSILQDYIKSYCMQRAQGRSSLNKTIFLNKEVSRKIANSPSKYVSECLNVQNQILTQFQSTSRSDFQRIFKEKLEQANIIDMKIYQKPIFCCFQLDYCLVKQQQSEFINVEIEGRMYIFTSGRLKRQRCIRDQILSHYGFKINHLDFNYYKLKTKLTAQDLLMSKSTQK